MRTGWTFSIFASVAALSLASTGAQAMTRHHHPHYTSTRNIGGMSVGVIQPGHVYSKYGHYQEMADDRESGVGFYQLPYQYRVGAWRYRLTHSPPPWAVPPAVAAAQGQAARTYGWEMPTPDTAYAYGVYNPVDGVGTPFFAGYYGPAGDDDDDSGFPFGHPYPPK